MKHVPAHNIIAAPGSDLVFCMFVHSLRRQLKRTFVQETRSDPWGLPLALLACILSTGLSAQAPRVQIRFEPESAQFEQAAAEYDALWKAEGSRIVDAMERVGGLPFEEREIRAVVFEGVSTSGFGDTPMRLRASYPHEIKKGTLIHELGHRFLARRVLGTTEIDEHRRLFLILL